MADLMTALRNADAAGDAEAARRIAAMIKAQQPQGGMASNISAGNLDVPGGGQVSQAAPTDRSLGEVLGGLGEAALTLGTGATTGAAGFLAGSVPDAIDQLAGNPDQKYRESFSQALTNTPEGEAGQEIVGDIGQALGSLPPVGLTGGVTPKIGLPNVKIPKGRNRTLNVLAEVAPEQVVKSFKKKLGEDHFTPRIFNMVKKARKQGFDDSVTTLVANASPTDRRKMAQMVSIVESGKGDARAKALTRTADVAGDALLKKIDFVKSNNKQAGLQLGRIAESLKDKKVNMLQPVDSFLSTIKDKLGVTFEKNGKPNFKGSDIETFPESQKLVNTLALKIKQNPNPSAFDAHKFKRLIDKSVRYGKSDGKLDPDLERAAKSLRKGVNDNLSAEFPKYKQANQQFSDTITTLDDLQDVAGRKLDFAGPNANKAAGTLLRSQTNNTKGRANLLTAIQNLEDTAKKYGGSFDDDILNLSIFADELDSVFGGGARTSLRGEVKKGNVDAAIDVSQMTTLGAIATGAKSVNKRIQGINEANQIKSIKELLKQ
jgi:hypothetical protein